MTNKKIGLALSGGAARGLAHIGVIKALVANNIPIDMISGTSAGSIIGAAFASGLTVDEMIDKCRKMNWFNMSNLSFSIESFLSNKPLANFIEKDFPATRFEDLTIPFAAIAADLETGEEVVMQGKGDLGFAIRASCAIPGIYRPLEDEHKRKLVDGAVATSLPTRIAREMGADIVIGVDVNADGIKYWGPQKTMLGVVLQSAIHLLKNNSKHQQKYADIMIMPKVGAYRFDELGKIDDLVRLGEESTLEQIEDIKKLIF
jgi:NTE family protein